MKKRKLCNRLVAGAMVVALAISSFSMPMSFQEKGYVKAAEKVQPNKTGMKLSKPLFNDGVNVFYLQYPAKLSLGRNFTPELVKVDKDSTTVENASVDGAVIRISQGETYNNLKYQTTSFSYDDILDMESFYESNKASSKNVDFSIRVNLSSTAGLYQGDIVDGESPKNLEESYVGENSLSVTYESPIEFDTNNIKFIMNCSQGERVIYKAPKVKLASTAPKDFNTNSFKYLWVNDGKEVEFNSFADISIKDGIDVMENLDRTNRLNVEYAFKSEDGESYKYKQYFEYTAKCANVKGDNKFIYEKFATESDESGKALYDYYFVYYDKVYKGDNFYYMAIKAKSENADDSVDGIKLSEVDSTDDLQEMLVTNSDLFKESDLNYFQLIAEDGLVKSGSSSGYGRYSLGTVGNIPYAYFLTGDKVLKDGENEYEFKLYEDAKDYLKDNITFNDIDINVKWIDPVSYTDPESRTFYIYKNDGVPDLELPKYDTKKLFNRDESVDYEVYYDYTFTDPKTGEERRIPFGYGTLTTESELTITGKSETGIKLALGDNKYTASIGIFNSASVTSANALTTRYIQRVTILRKNNVEVSRHKTEYEIIYAPKAPAYVYGKKVSVDADEKNIPLEVKIGENAAVSDGYEIAGYQWYKGDSVDEDNIIEGANSATYVVPDATNANRGKYTVSLLVCQKGDSQKKVAYKTSGTFEIGILEKPYEVISNDGAELYEVFDKETNVCPVGESFEAKPEIRVLNDKADIKYEWSALEYKYFSLKDLSQNPNIKDGYTIYNTKVTYDPETDTNYDVGVYCKLVKLDNTSSSFKHKLVLDDIATLTDEGYLTHLYNVSLTIKYKNPNSDTYVDGDSFYWNVGEKIEEKKIYAEGQAERIVNSYVSGVSGMTGYTNRYAVPATIGSAVNIISSKYAGPNDNYKVEYTWYRWVYNREIGSSNWIQVSSEDADNTFRVDKVEKYDNGNVKEPYFRLDVKIVNKDTSKTLINKTEYFEIQNANPIVTINAGRTTDQSIKVAVGDKISLGVNAQIKEEDSKYELKYVWYHDGKAIKNSSGKLSTGQVYEKNPATVGDFGTYTCYVYAAPAGTEATDDMSTYIEPKAVTFYVSEDHGIVIKTPSANFVSVNEGMDKDLVVEVTAPEGLNNVRYQWTFAGRDLDNIKNVLSLKNIKVEDFGAYICSVYEDSTKVGEVQFIVVDVDAFWHPYIKGASANLDGGVVSGEFSKPLTMEVGIQVNGNSHKLDFEYQWYVNVNGVDEIIEGANKSSYTVPELKSEDFKKSRFKCAVTATIDGDKENKQKEWVTIDVEPAINKKHFTYDLVGEYGAFEDNGRNNVGDKIRIGVENVNSEEDLLYQWTFEKGVDSDTGLPVDEFSVEYLDVKSPVIEKTLTENDFGRYTLKAYFKNSYDSNGDRLLAFDEVYVVRKMSNIRVFGPLNDYSEFTRKFGEPVTFTVERLRGTGEVQYQWYNNDIAIMGATSSQYKIAAVKPYDIGEYTCVISNVDGEQIDRVEFTLKGSMGLTLSSPLMKSEEYDYGKSDYKVFVGYKDGEDVSLPVTAKTDDPNGLSYVWEYSSNNKTFYKISDKKDISTYVVKNAQPGDQGYYRCTVSDSYSKATATFELYRKTDGVLQFKYVEDDDPDDNYAVLVDGNYYDKGVSSKTETFWVSGGEKLRLDASAVATEGLDIVYSWSVYDNVQGRYVTLAEGKNLSTYDITVDENINWQTMSTTYRCIVKAGGNQIEYIGELESAMEDKAIRIKTDKNYVVEGGSITYTAIVGDNGEDWNYQWYTYDDDGNLVAVKGANSKTLTVKTDKNPKPDSADKYASVKSPLTGDSAFKEYTYYCQVTRGNEDSYEEYHTSKKISVVSIPDECQSSLPSSILPMVENNVQAYEVKGAKSLRIKFSDQCSLILPGSRFSMTAAKNIILGYVHIITPDGKETIYPDKNASDIVATDITGKTIEVKGSKAIIFFENAVTGEEAIMYELLFSGSSQYGYKVESIDDTATYEARIEAEKKKAEEDAARDAKIEQLQKDIEALKNGSVEPTSPSSSSSSSTTANKAKASTAKKVAKNPTKKIKAVKKKITVKKNKKVKITFKVTAKKKKKKTTDKLKVKVPKKLGKVKKKLKKVGKVVITFKAGKKKKKGVMKVKLGKKTAKVKITVK
ncbi:MAG: immunoglobulin domain-containing protein [Eubacterium sp.]|nr:immunoglobulin domain-containing protein [Eubacterium sp.]